MNLLVKKLSTKNILKPGLMILISVFFGCETQNDLGIKYELDSDANVKFAEFTLPATNIYIDSLRTDGENKIIVGNYNDPLTGSVSAEGYFQFFFVGGTLPNDSLSFEEITTSFDVNSIIGPNGLQTFNLSVSNDSLISNAVYLSNNKLDNTGIPIGSDTLIIDNNEQIRFKLSDLFGLDLYGRIKDDDTFLGPDYKSPTLVLESDGSNMFLFDTESEDSWLRIFMTGNDPDTIYVAEFGLLGIEHSSIERSRTGTPFEGIEEKSDWDLSDGRVLIDPVAGLSAAFSIKELEQFFQENGNILINNATISFDFTAENGRDTIFNFMNYFRKPDKSFYGPAIVSNPFGNIVMADNGYLSLQSNPARGILNEDKTQILSTSTLFYQQLYRDYVSTGNLSYTNPMTGESMAIEELVLISPTDVTLQRTIFKENGIKLRLYYTEVDQ